MADKTVRLESDSGSPHRVAFELMEKITFKDKNGSYSTKQELIDLYVDCLWAVQSFDRNGGK